jgi:hypothetical protein
MVIGAAIELEFGEKVVSVPTMYVWIVVNRLARSAVVIQLT